MNHKILYYTLISLSILGVISYIFCALRITFRKIKKSKFTKRLSFFLIIYFGISIIWLNVYKYIPKIYFINTISIILCLGVIISPVILLVGIPGNAIRFDRDRNDIKPYFIGLVSLIVSVAIWVLIQKLGYQAF